MSTKTTLTRILDGRKSRRLSGVATYLRSEPDGTLALRYHNTDVIRVRPDGAVQVNTDGWHTPTTKERINSYLDESHMVAQVGGVWYWYPRTGDWSERKANRVPFTDGDTFTPAGKLVPLAPRDAEKDSKKLVRDINTYAKKCADAVPLAKPSNADCWYCSLRTQDGTPMGESSGDISHLQSHIDEGYVVPSLVFNAMREANRSAPVINSAFDKSGVFTVVAKDFVRRDVAKYLKRRLGLAAGRPLVSA